ncbi:unnamed protein product [Caenorhabditis auriculariae]|uniref:Uncharacterized protein n=1 Tax=Caenorhabditis auriculariae TaxID=2777116 RepID=A0A8S1HXK0_9PELO|nr:unnamed protein product [Caenorhabditis auriculariae]
MKPNQFQISSPQYFPLILGGFLRTRFIVLISLILPYLVVERSLATKFVKDYENQPRKFISILALVFGQIFATIVSASAILTIIGILEIVAFAFVVNAAASMMFAVLNHRNQQLILKINSFRVNDGRYTLAKKFQIEENLRVLIAFKYVLIIVGLVGALILITFVLGYVNFLPSGMNIVDHLLIELLVYM